MSENSGHRCETRHRCVRRTGPTASARVAASESASGVKVDTVVLMDFMIL
jgi:hypothetical protein